MKISRDNNHNSRKPYHGRLSLSALVVSVLCISVSFAGITRNGGRIQGFASIFVNAREFDIDNAVITIDGLPGSEADLRLGQIVLLRGDADEVLPTGSATEVNVEDTVEGPIEMVDADNNLLVVLGQTVVTDADTVVDTHSGSYSLEDLQINDAVEVSGFFSHEGDILATRVEQKTPGGQMEVTGVVNGLTAGTFSINALEIDFSSAVLNNFPATTITEGDFVEAKGMLVGINGELIAAQVELKGGVSGNAGELGEFEGLINEFSAATRFSVARVPVRTDEQTLFVGGGPNNLTNNTSVEVAGVFDAVGVLIADRVVIRGTRIRIHAQVDSASAASLTMLGITATTDSTSRLKDNSSAKNTLSTLSNLYPGDYVEVRSGRNAPDSIPFLAARVTRVDPESDVRLQGFVGSANTLTFDVHGVAIDVDDDTDYLDANGGEISASEFFAALTDGTFVVVHGVETTNTGVLASQVELALDD